MGSVVVGAVTHHQHAVVQLRAALLVKHAAAVELEGALQGGGARGGGARRQALW